MFATLHETQLSVNRVVARRHNDRTAAMCDSLQMAQLSTIHRDKTPRRIHYIPEWAEKRRLTQAAIVRGIGADKGLVSRWFKGTIPSEKYLGPLAALLQAEEPAALFRSPDEDWLSRLFAERSEEERRRMLQTLEAAFPRKQSSKGD
jgi:transcriptional regulator with XRE-family HTH domain